MEKRTITARLVRQGEEEKDFDRAFWRDAGPEACLDAAWQMVVEYARFPGFR